MRRPGTSIALARSLARRVKLFEICARDLCSMSESEPLDVGAVPRRGATPEVCA
jgi:hypothetical protein